MVWNTTQSAFYKAIDDFNNRGEIREEQPLLCEDGGNKRDKEFLCEECSESDREKRPHYDEKIRPERCLCRDRCPKRQTSPLDSIFSDKDKLLIAGLIMILSRQNADMKLIMALAFVLLT